MRTISELNAPHEEFGGRRSALRSASASVTGVRRHMASRVCMAQRATLEPTIEPWAGSAGARDLLLASVGEADSLLQRTLRTLGVVQQRSLADFLG